ncbi:hypothetical protein RHGRI_006526 [Rhododendron griersonianum]|uniref:Uncharacterized protein n=1 Tax=Rhododendron griersonianum TaxID=479676 RepID=A0AAV6KV15_9ERIC|nr:hypothetical protein RHGRI_006526 [Rhododendron griersonianum]
MAESILGKIGEVILGKVGDNLVAPIQHMCYFNSNITELETQLKGLKRTREDVQMGVDENRRKVRVVGRTVEAWLTIADEVTTEAEGIIQDKAKVMEGCLNGWCPNLKLRYSLSRKAVKKTKEVVDLKADGVWYTQSSYSPPLPCLETITNRDFMGFESRRLIMEEIIKALKHDEINLIGVCGMGGVGKTTMVNEVAQRAKEDNHFDEVAIAVVSQEPNLTYVQACIADMLGLKNLRDMESPIARADLLRRRLLQDNKKVLVILDDIWVEFDLQAMGIPLEGADKNFKVLYTSRNQDLWRDLRTKKEIPLEVLSKDEAWQLFREKVGNSADAPDLRPIAEQIVDECGCLPLALVLIGSALLKKSGRNAIKKIWEHMLDRLTCATSTLVDERLYSCLKTSYEYLEEEAKSLFLLCCLFKEDEDIRLEDLARYGFGLSLFDGINELRKARNRVFALVDDLKSSYLLLDCNGKHEEECVKVHDVVRDMGLSIATDKFALVSHGAISQWPKTATPEHYTAISVISDQIEELPEELTYRNLEFLMLRCQKLEKLPPNFFEGMGKLKVLELCGFCGILTLQSLRNLTSLSLEGFGGMLDNVSVMGDLQNLETLSFRDSEIEKVPKEIGKLIQLRLLDLRGTRSLTRIKPGVISRLVHLEELYFWGSKYSYWEGEGKKGEVRNANLGEFESLSNLNTLEIYIRSDVIIPKVPIFSKLKIYMVKIADQFHHSDIGISPFHSKFERVLWVHSSIPIPSDRGGIVYSLLRSSDWLSLEGEGCNDLVRELLLRDMPKQLELSRLPNLREICCGPVRASSFEELTYIGVGDCERLENLFKLPIEGCLTRQEDVHVATNNIIVFPKLEFLDLRNLPRLMSFCRGIDQIDFPQLKSLWLQLFNHLFDNNCNLASNSDQNDNVGFLSFFPQKVSLPNLEHLIVAGLQNLERLGHGSLSVGSLSKLKRFTVQNCGSLEVVFELEGLESNEPNPEILSPLKFFELCYLPKLNYISKRDPMVFKYIQTLKIYGCKSLRYVFAPTLIKSIPQLRELKISSCEMLSRIVAEENGLGESSVDEVEFPQLERLELLDLPNLVTFFPNVNTTLAKSTDHLRNPMQPQPLFNEKVAFPGLKYLELNGLQNVNDLWGSELPTNSFSKLETLNVRDFAKLRSTFHPSIVGGLANLSELVITDCLKMEGVVYWEEEIEGGQGRKVKKILFPLLRKLQLSNLPDLVSFFPNVNTTLEKLTDHYHNPMQPQPLFNEKVAFPCLSLKYLGLSGLRKVSDLWGSELSTSSLSKLKNLEVTGCMSLRKLPCILWIDDLNNTTQGLQEATTSVLPRQDKWDSQRMTNDVIGVNLKEAVPCMALSKNNYIISACGREVSLFHPGDDTVERKRFMPPPPASTFLAFFPRYDDIIAIGMEDSTIHIYDLWDDEVQSKMKGHKKRITGLVCSTILNILVSSGADAQLCIWRIDTWEHLKSVPIQLPAAGKACNGDTRVQFHSDQIRLLVSHETQLAIYDASEMDRIRQWVPQNVLPAPISFAVYSCDSQLVYTSFCDGNIGVFDADSLTIACRIVPSIYLYPAMLSAGQAVYPRVVAAHPEKPNQFAIGFTNGFVLLMEPGESKGKWGLSPSIDNGMLNDRTASSSNTINLTPDQNGDGPMARSMEKPKTLDDVTDKSKPWKVAETQCQLVVMPDSTDEAHKVARLLYKNGCEVLALGCNGALRLWRRYSSINNQSGMATASVVPQQWQPASGLAMTNDVTGVNLEEAVPCMALSKNYRNMISACGGKVSLLSNIETFKVKSELKGHEKRITGLAFSTNLNILVSSGADAQLCIWSIDTWERLKSVPIQLPVGKASYSCDSQLVYTSFCDGNIGVFDADSLTPTHHIAPSAYSPMLSSGSHAVYPLAIATHPWKPNQFAIGLTNGSVIIMEPQESEGKWGLSSNTSNHAPDQNQKKEEEELDEDEDEDDQEEFKKKERTAKINDNKTNGKNPIDT